jgi:hypothetical protein
VFGVQSQPTCSDGGPSTSKTYEAASERATLPTRSWLVGDGEATRLMLRPVSDYEGIQSLYECSSQSELG